MRLAKVYPVMSDEVTDSGGKKFLTIMLRYVKGKFIIERVIALARVADMSGSALSDIVFDRLVRLGVVMNRIVGQCYDGASNMSGIYNGLQEKLRQKGAFRALFVHCWAHKLELVLADAMKKFQAFASMLHTIGDVRECFGGYKVAALIERESAAKLTLQSLSSTRWSATCTYFFHTGFRYFHKVLSI